VLTFMYVVREPTGRPWAVALIVRGPSADGRHRPREPGPRPVSPA